MDFETGLEATVEWYRSNQDWMKRVKSGEYQSFYTQNYANRESLVAT
jgi:dTDP-glucose 4,6-dehydratase